MTRSADENSNSKRCKGTCGVPTKSDQLIEQMSQFGATQLIGLRPGNISQSTIHLILTTAFFTGAIIHLNKPLGASKKEYLHALTEFLAEKFKISNKNAKGSVESNARLYKRFILIEKCFNHGWAAAQSWGSNTPNTEDSLESLLKQYQDIGMSDLSVEGVKEETITPPPVVKTITHVEPAPASRHKIKPRKSGRPFFWLTLMAIATTVTYFSLHPEQIPPELKIQFHYWLLKIEHTKLPFLN